MKSGNSASFPVLPLVNRCIRPLVLLALAVAAGCAPAGGPQAGDASHLPKELPWKRQVAQVREGVTTGIQAVVQPVSSTEFLMLAEGCESLRILEVNQSGLPEDIFLEVLDSLPNLERLRLTGPVSDRTFQAVARLPRLTILNLPQGEFGDAALDSLAGHPALELLRFHSPRVSDAGLKVLRAIPNLRFLHLIDVPITDGGLGHLHGLGNLESFYLDGGNCTEAGLSELIRHLPELHFHWNDLHLPDDPRRHHAEK